MSSLIFVGKNAPRRVAKLYGGVVASALFAVTLAACTPSQLIPQEGASDLYSTLVTPETTRTTLHALIEHHARQAQNVILDHMEETGQARPQETISRAGFEASPAPLAEEASFAWETLSVRDLHDFGLHADSEATSALLSFVLKNPSVNGPKAWKEAVKRGSVSDIQTLLETGTPLPHAVRALLTDLDLASATYLDTPQKSRAHVLQSLVVVAVTHQSRMTEDLLHFLMDRPTSLPTEGLSIILRSGAHDALIQANPSLLLKAVTRQGFHGLDSQEAHVGLVKALLQAGADPTARCPLTGETALTALVRNFNVDQAAFLKVFMEHARTPQGAKLDLNAPNYAGKTPFEIAAAELSENIVRMQTLKAQGGKIEGEASPGSTLTEIASHIKISTALLHSFIGIAPDQEQQNMLAFLSETVPSSMSGHTLSRSLVERLKGKSTVAVHDKALEEAFGPFKTETLSKKPSVSL